MAKIDRYGGNLEAFASEAIGQERTVFGTETFDDSLTAQINALFRRGWGIVAPADAPKLQDFNALGYTTTQVLAYLHQMGIAEWNAGQLYYTDSATIHNGRIWIAQIDEPTEEPGVGTEWQSVLSPDDADSDATPGALAERDAQGTFKVSEATDPAHPVRQQEFSEHLDSTEAHAAEDLTYNPTASTLTAAKVQGAIDEAAGRLDDLEDIVFAEEAATVSWNMSTDTWTGDPKATAAHESMRRCIVDNTGVVQYYLDEFDSTLQEDGVTPANLDGTDGQVMVEITPFYVRTAFNGAVSTWSVSPDPLPGYTLHPAFEGGVSKTYVGAYDAIVYDTSAAAHIDGLNLENNTSRVNLSEDLLASVSTGNFPMVGLTRNEFRTLAENAGFQLYDFWQWQAVMMLFITEYGSWNSQAVLGRGNVDRSSYPPSSNDQSDSPQEAPGLSNSIGNGSGGIDDADGDPWVSYRGIENPWGNCWTWLDGWNVQDRQSYVSNDETVYADDTSAGYSAIGDTLPVAPNSAIKNWQFVDNVLLVREVDGGASTSAYVTDHFKTDTGWRAASVGGSAGGGLPGGLAVCSLQNDSVNRNRGHGARISKKLRS